MQMDMAGLYALDGERPYQELQTRLMQGPDAAQPDSLSSLRGIVWTPATRRMYTLLDRSASL